MSSQVARYQIYNLINRKTDVSEIERLLKEGKSPNASPQGCPPPLHRAVRFNRPDIALALLSAGCQVRTSKQVERFHSPTITIAASLNMTQVVLNLCAKPECNAFAVDGQLQTIVHIAVVRRNYELLQGLFSCHRSSFSKLVTTRDGLGLTPLHLAASVGDVRILKLLLQVSCETSESEQPPKSQSDHTGGDLSVDKDDVCSNSTQNTNCEETPASCKMYVSDTRKVADQFSTPARQKFVDYPVLGSKETMLHLAARGHHIQAVQLLVSCAANVNARDMMNNTPLHWLVSHGNADHRATAVARFLLNSGADWSLRGSYEQRLKKSSDRCPVVEKPQCHHRYKKVTVGMIAAGRNRVAYLKLLAEFGARFEEVDAMNMTTLMHALSHGCEEAARFLLLNHTEQNVFHNWTDRMGNTALHYVSYCRGKAGELTELMLNRGYGAALRSGLTTDSSCSARVPGQLSFTPVTTAIANRRLDVLRTLVRHDPRCLLEDNYTQVSHSPLHMTLRWIPDSKCAPFVDFLLAQGCDGNAVVCGQTAYEYAVRGAWEVFCAAYLKRKLGVVFCEGGGCGGRSSGQEAWPLRDLCLEQIRRAVRAARRSYFEDISSLSLPPSVIRDLLFES